MSKLRIKAIQVRNMANPFYRNINNYYYGTVAPLAAKWVMGLLLLFSFAQSRANTCEAGFMFAFLDDEHVVLYNTSVDFNTYQWDLGGIPLSFDGNGVALFTMQGASVQVCLSVSDGQDCVDMICRDVFPGSPDEMCELTDCVWPGDANGDGKANQYDLLHMGLDYGLSGPPRTLFPSPSNPIAWAPNFAEDWTTSSAGVNDKHLDCNGDGFIADNDFNAIHLNYNPEFAFSSTSVVGAPPVYLELETPFITITEDSTYEVIAHLMIGEAAFPIDNLHGLALDLGYPFDLVLPGTATIDYDSDEFFGVSGEVLTLERDLYAQNLGRHDWAMSRRNDAQGIAGHGRAATVRYVVSSDIIGGRSEPEIPFDIIIERVKAIDVNGNPITISLPHGGVFTVILINDTVAGTPGDDEPQVSVFPNPAGGRLYVEWANLAATRVSLLNLMGQPVWEQAAEGRQVSANVDSLAPGLYWVVLHAAEGAVVRRVSIR